MIKNIIFDLGGVLLDINYHDTFNAFKKLGISNFDDVYSQAKQNELFDDIETGAITDQEFLGELKNMIGTDISNDKIATAWNALLGDFPIERLDLLRKVGRNYRIYLLSNTNIIHLLDYRADLISKFGEDVLKTTMEEVYYSHEIGKRKPNHNAFLHVTEANGLALDETLFIDDSIQHIEAASKLGITACHLTDKSILDLFDENGYLIS